MAYRARVRWGSARDRLTERVDLEAGVVIDTPAFEWYVFEWEPGGFVEILFSCGQVDDDRPKDTEKDA